MAAVRSDPGEALPEVLAPATVAPAPQPGLVSLVAQADACTGGPAVRVRPAVQEDAGAIAEVINTYASSNLLLPRSEENIRGQIGSFLVADREGEVLGTVALHVYTAELAELRSLAVREHVQGLGLGKSLVAACIERARELGMARLFALTYRIAFFLRHGFVPVSKQTLPEKVWTDCIHCARYYDCTEVAMVLVLRPAGPQPLSARSPAAR